MQQVSKEFQKQTEKMNLMSEIQQDLFAMDSDEDSLDEDTENIIDKI